jgi:hypothetical protein
MIVQVQREREREREREMAIHLSIKQDVGVPTGWRIEINI